MTLRPPRVLSTVYGNGLQSFYELVVDLISEALLQTEDAGRDRGHHRPRARELREEAEARLVMDNDPVEYDSLLQTSHAAMPDSAPTLGTASFEQRWTQQQIVERVMELQFRQHDRPAHVLCSGYLKLRPKPGDNSSRRRAPQGLECTCENSSMDVVASKSWQLLLSRILGAPISGSARKFLSLIPSKEMLDDFIHRKAPKERHSMLKKQAARVQRSAVEDGATYATKHGESPANGKSNDGSKEAYHLKKQTADEDVAGAVEFHRSLDTTVLTTFDDAKIWKNSAGPRKLEICSSLPSSFSKRPRKVAIHSDIKCNKRKWHGQYSELGRGEALRKRQKILPRAQFLQQTKSSKILDKKMKRSIDSSRGPNYGTSSAPGTDQISGDTPADKSLRHSLRPTDDAKKSQKKVSLMSRKREKAAESCQGVADNALQSLEPPEQLCGGTETGNGSAHVILSGLHLLSEAIDKAGDVGRLAVSGEGVKDNGRGSTGPEHVHPRTRNPHSIDATFGTEQWLVDRASIFYKSTYGRHAGLPAKHILNTIKANDSGVGNLFSTIFGPHCNLSVSPSSGNHIHANHHGKLKSGPSQGNQVKSAHKLLKELISNAKRCEFGRLLGRHCPLPQGFRTPPTPSSRCTASVPQFHSETSPHSEIHDSEFGNKDMKGDEHRGCLSTDLQPDLQEFMRLWLGHHYELQTEKPTTRVVGAASKISGKDQSNTRERFQQNGQLNKGQRRQTVKENVWVKPDDSKKSGVPVENVRGEDNRIVGGTFETEHISYYSRHSAVVAFLWAVCRSIVPQDMLGCVWSWRSLRSIIAHFVSLRRHEKFSVQHALFKLKVSSFPWLAFNCCGQKNCTSIPHVPSEKFAVNERRVQQKRLELWISWLFRSLIVPLIRAHFYVTENENCRQNVFYYRKPVWARIQSTSLKELTRKNYEKLTKYEVSQMLGSRLLGFSQLRLLPKRTGVRPIAKLSTPSQGALTWSVRAKRPATLLQVFGARSTDLSVGDFSRHHRSTALKSSHETACSVVENGRQMTSGEAILPFSSAEGKDYVVVSGVGACPSSSIVNERGFSCFSSGHERFDTLSVLRAPNCQKRFRNTVNFHFRSINSVLGDVHCCLKLEKDSHPDDLGCSVFGYSDIHAKILPFILQLKSCPAGMPRLFMAVCDVAKAFDTIPQKKLQKIIENFVQFSSYKVTRYTSINPTLASVRISHGKACTRPDEPHKPIDTLGNLASKRPHSIFVDEALSKTLTREQILAVLGEHVKHNIVQIGAHFYRQTVGIPQGSVLSPLLCSMFYGHSDAHWLLPLVEAQSSSHNPQDDGSNRHGVASEAFDRDFILLRLIDDSVFISTSERKARAFVELMHRGSDEYGCQVNERKTSCGFPRQLGNEILPESVYRTEDGACFIRWSGILINRYTMELQADYTRYCGEHIRSTLTVRREENQRWHLVLQLCRYMRPKCHALFFDPRINSPATIRLNAFQAFLLCAMKFHAYVCCLPQLMTTNQLFLCKAVDCAIRYMYGLLRHKMDTVGAKADAHFPYRELQWLALVAFDRVLRRKQARYSVLLSMLRAQLQMSEFLLLRALPHLLSATDGRRSSMFKFIKY